ncbi:MAG: acetoin utilization protein AcuC [Chloroflexi bacterium]|nr:acetoin utilization protein AcuC [Chloroflexota bacterium]
MPFPQSPSRVVVVYSDEVWRYEMSDTHPLRPIRRKRTYDLMEAAGLTRADNISFVPPRPATDDEITLGHTPEYLGAVKTLSSGLELPVGPSYGFGPGDNPVFNGMFEANALTSGATMVAAHAIADGSADVAFNFAGGHQHHAMSDRASGFGVFNDTVMAAQWLADQGMRVAYIDIDCHHGDGVQAGFYDTPDVLTVSLHESGQFLFPGTGNVRESGRDAGENYSVNVPLAPHTSDVAYLAAFDAVVPQLVEAFNPDVLFTQLGVDTHVLDPITHLRLTVQGHAAVVGRLRDLASECGRWLAVGGGGYDLGAVARAWSVDLAIMAEIELPPELPITVPESPVAYTYADTLEPSDELVDMQISAFNDRSVEQVRELIFPHHGLG